MEADKPARRRTAENRIDKPGDSFKLSLPSDSVNKMPSALKSEIMIPLKLASKPGVPISAMCRCG
jgi:hypothetical protein